MMKRIDYETHNEDEWKIVYRYKKAIIGFMVVYSKKGRIKNGMKKHGNI